VADGGHVRRDPDRGRDRCKAFNEEQNLNKFPEAGFINFPDWLVTAFVKWNIGHREAAQRYSAHGACAGSQQAMKLYYAAIMKDANELGFEMPYTKALGAYLK
jgi:hypothetical protein